MAGMSQQGSTGSGNHWPRVGGGGRNKFRRAADAEAHAGTAELPVVVDHPLVPGSGAGADEVEMVQTAGELADLVEQLRAADRFAFDTEFIGEESYYARFCLVQVATPEKIWLIDPLAEGVDLRPFWELLAVPAGDPEVAGEGGGGGNGTRGGRGGERGGAGGDRACGAAGFGAGGAAGGSAGGPGV